MGSELQCSIKQQWNMVVLVGIDNRFFPVEEEEEEEEEENKQQLYLWTKAIGGERDQNYQCCYL